MLKFISVTQSEKALEKLSTTTTKKLKSDKISTYKITPLGLTMSQFPVGPRFGKMLSMSFNHSLTDYMVLISSALTVQVSDNLHLHF